MFKYRRKFAVNDYLIKASANVICKDVLIPFNISTEISMLWVALRGFSLFLEILILTQRDWNSQSEFLAATAVGWFFYFKITLNIVFKILLVSGSIFSYLEFFGFFTVFEKNEFETSLFWQSLFIISFPSSKVIFSRNFSFYW